MGFLGGALENTELGKESVVFRRLVAFLKV